MIIRNVDPEFTALAQVYNILSVGDTVVIESVYTSLIPFILCMVAPLSSIIHIRPSQTLSQNQGR